MNRRELQLLKGQNPDRYPSKPYVVISLGIVYAVLITVKILIMIINEPHIGMGRARNRLEGHPRNLREYLLEFIFWANLIVNVWSMSWLFKGEKEKTIKFSWIPVVKSWSFYMFLLVKIPMLMLKYFQDVFLLLALPIPLNLPEDVCRLQHLLVILAIVPCGFVYFYLVNAHHIMGYNPDAYCDKLVFDKAYDEFMSSPTVCTIKESGAFRITIENNGHEVILRGIELIIERVVMWKEGTGAGRGPPFRTRVKFTIKVPQELQIGERLTIIPETHYDPPALRVEGYRSFGNTKGTTVTTYVFSKKEDLLTKYTQEFKGIMPIGINV